VIKDKTANIVIITVTAVWVLNFFAGLFINGYSEESINGIFMAIVGGVFALKGFKRSDDEDEN
jgi:hypothetical protein